MIRYICVQWPFIVNKFSAAWLNSMYLKLVD